MQKLVKGIHHFQSKLFAAQRDLFESLARGQSPETLFITCSDSRINPNLITQTDPGDLFILRNAGNIIPPYGAANGGEGATIEFAISGLGVRDVIVCGHSHCGAMRGLLNSASLEGMPSVAEWLRHAEATRRIVRDKYSGLSDTAALNVAIQENVLVQLENLRTHPAVSSAVAQNKLRLHAWVYKIETGQVFAFSPETEEFLPISDRSPTPVPPPAKLTAAYDI